MTPFITQRLLPASPAEVFAAIQDPQRLARWWGPDGFTNQFDTFEFRPQGRWVFTMVGPDGKAYPNECEFVRIEADRLVVVRHVGQPHFDLTLTLQPAQGGTLLHWEQVLDDDDIARALAPMIEPANEQNLDRLTRELVAGAIVSN